MVHLSVSPFYIKAVVLGHILCIVLSSLIYWPFQVTEILYHFPHKAIGVNVGLG